MPIKGLTNQAPQFPMIGELRKGAPKPEQGDRPGRDLTYFRFTSDLEGVCEAFEAAYDGEPRLINVFLPFPTVDENWEAWQEEYAAGGLKHRCDGEYVVRVQDKDGTYTDPEPGTVKCPGGCKPAGRLKVIIPELQRLAYVLVLTTSKWDILNLDGQLRALYEIKRDLRGIPLQLRRRPEKKSTPSKGKRVRREIWLLSIEAAPTYVALQLAAQEAAALPKLPETTRPIVVDSATGEIVDDDWEPELFDAGEDEPMPEPPPEPDEEEVFGPPPDFLTVQIPKGHRAGKTMGWLAQFDPDYLGSVADGAKDASIREAAQLTLEWANNGNVQQSRANQAQEMIEELADQKAMPI